MTSPIQPDLIERLNAVESSGDELGGEIGTNSYRNPDGPEAATAITTLSAQLERVTEALEQLRASCTRTAPALHDDCGTRLVTAPTVEKTQEGEQ